MSGRGGSAVATETGTAARPCHDDLLARRSVQTPYDMAEVVRHVNEGAVHCHRIRHLCHGEGGAAPRATRYRCDRPGDGSAGHSH